MTKREICLMYHDVYKTTPLESGFSSDLYKINVDTFNYHLNKIKQLKNEGYNIVLTFDDGGSSFYDPISGLLDKYGLKGIFFISTKFIEKPGFLTIEQIKDIYHRGHIIGSHSHSHPENMASLDQASIKEEWEKSTNILGSIIKAPIKYASIPNGYQSRDILQSASICGIENLFNSCPTGKIKQFGTMALHGRYVVLSTTGVKGIEQLCKSNFFSLVLYIKHEILSIPKFLLGNRYEAVKNILLGIES